LEELVAYGELSIPEAAGEDVLRGNAIRLYRLSSG
jgi:predicted TIM-barrel fold metal-dependent hydrolase